MREIEPTTRFRRDYRREKSGVAGKKLDALLQDAIKLLAADQALPVVFCCFDLLHFADTPADAFEKLRSHLTEHHLQPATDQESAAPGIAKTRG